MVHRTIANSPQRSQATVAMGFVTGMLAGVRRRQIDPAPILEALAIDIADTASRIPIDRYAALYNRLNRQLDDEGFALFAQPMRVGSFEFLCRGCLSAPTLAEALARACRFLHVVLPDLAVSVRRSHGHAELVIAETRKLAEDTDDPGRVFAFEWLLRLLHSLSCWLVGRGLALDSALAVATAGYTKQLVDMLDEAGADKGYKAAWIMNPGTGDWPSGQMANIAQAVHAEQIGVSLLPSGMLMPRKTVTGVIGLNFIGGGCSGSCSACAMAGHCGE